MKKILSFFIVLVLFFINLQAENVPVNEAELVAENVYFEHFGIKQQQLSFDLVYTEYNKSTALYYVFNRTDDIGFVIISADDRVYPILGFSTESKYYNDEHSPIQFIAWLDNYSKQIKYAINNDLKPNQEIVKTWQKYNCLPAEFVADKNLKNVDPLLGDIIWDQDNGWNDYCPTDPSGPGGHVYAGCVATAAGQVMKYWDYPEQGEGSHSYNATGYGTQTANFGNTTYDWDNMADGYPTDAAALLLYHIGVAVEMQYGPDGSGAYTSDLVNALPQYFLYQTSIDFQNKSWHPNDWDDILIEELDLSRPMVYKGSDGNTGHAFVCDGYTGTQFHFNWGWSGYNNGYFYTDDLTPGYNNFNQNQGAIFGIEPDWAANLEPPVNLQASVNQNDVTLTWEPPETKDLIGYIIFRDDNAITDTLPASLLVFSDSNLENGLYTYCIKAVYDVGTSECSDPRSANVNYTIIAKNESEISLFPNPVNNSLKIVSDNKQIKEIIISTISGKNIYKSKNINKLSQNIDFSTFDKGIYLIEIKTDKNILYKKIIKN